MISSFGDGCNAIVVSPGDLFWGLGGGLFRLLRFNYRLSIVCILSLPFVSESIISARLRRVINYNNLSSVYCNKLCIYSFYERRLLTAIFIAIFNGCLDRL